MNGAPSENRIHSWKFARLRGSKYELISGLLHIDTPVLADQEKTFMHHLWGVSGEMVTAVEIDTATRVQTLDESVYISHCAHTLGGKYGSNYSFSRYGKIVGQTVLFNLGKATGLGARKH